MNDEVITEEVVQEESVDEKVEVTYKKLEGKQLNDVDVKALKQIGKYPE